MAGSGWPVLPDAAAQRLIDLPKRVAADWRQVLLNPPIADRQFRKTRLYLGGEEEAGPVRGELFLYSRLRKDEEEPRRTYTFGLGLRDRVGRDYRLLRCNGPSHPHVNKVEGDRLPPVCHVHRITERYQLHLAHRPKWEGDGFAIISRPYAGPDDALTDLASLVNIEVEEALFA